MPASATHGRIGEVAQQQAKRKLTRVVWNSKYCIGIDEIDEQHERLFDIVNRMMTVYESAPDDITVVLTDLTEYLNEHFRTEQRIMLEYDYPDYLAHSLEHQKFTEKVIEFLDDLEAGKKKVELARDVLAFLRKWLMNHVLATWDPAFGEYVKSHEPEDYEAPV